MILARNVIREVAEQSKRAILFHSASGKDSIALLDLMSKDFEEIVCCFMYVVKDLEHIARYIDYAQKKYSNVRFVQVPHFGLLSYIKYGYMGCQKNASQKLLNLSDITDIVRNKTGIDWAFFGFKQSDSLNRRLMLRNYDRECINWETKKCYPLSKCKNKEILEYIKHNRLIVPECYDNKHQSMGQDISDCSYLLYLRKNYPNDLRRVVEFFPYAERILFEYDKRNNN